MKKLNLVNNIIFMHEKSDFVENVSVLSSKFRETENLLFDGLCACGKFLPFVWSDVPIIL